MFMTGDGVGLTDANWNIKANIIENCYWMAIIISPQLHQRSNTSLPKLNCIKKQLLFFKPHCINNCTSSLRPWLHNHAHNQAHLHCINKQVFPSHFELEHQADIFLSHFDRISKHMNYAPQLHQIEKTYPTRLHQRASTNPYSKSSLSTKTNLICCHHHPSVSGTILLAAFFFFGIFSLFKA